VTPDQLLMSAEEVRASAQSLSLFEGFPLFAASSCYPLLYYFSVKLLKCQILNCGEAPAEYLDLAVPENPDQWNRRWSLEVSAITRIMSSAWPFLQASPGKCFIVLPEIGDSP